MSIGNQLVFDINGNVEDFIFILSTKDYRHLGAISNVIPESVHYGSQLVNGSEISFEVYKTVHKEIDNEYADYEEPLWEEIVDLKSVYVRELDEYFEINVQLDDSTEIAKKTVTCTSLCKAELSQNKIRGLEVNTEIDISRPDYDPTNPTVFYNSQNTSSSLLDRVLSFMPGYTIMHVDPSLCNIQRTFSVDDVAIYDWFIGDCANEFNCLFQFDTTNRGIYVYDLYTVCKNCGHRGEYIDKCPKCGSIDLDYFGEDTTIYIDKENLTDSLQLVADVGSIKNCFYLEAGDDVITSTVRLLNMNGTGFIFMPTDEQLAEMPQEVRDKILSYNAKVLAIEDEYAGLIANIFDVSAQIDELTHTMMPSVEDVEITAETEAAKLTEMNLSPLGLSSVTTSTSKSTVESALKNYAKVYVNTGYVKVEVATNSFNETVNTYTDENGNKWNSRIWTGKFKVTSYVDEEDVAETGILTIIVTDNYQNFLEQKVLKNISTNSDSEDSVFDVLLIEDLSDFKDALKEYCLKRLESFYDAIQSALDVLLEVDQASKSADLYDVLYVPYYEKLIACQYELDMRQREIDVLQTEYDSLITQQQKIQIEMDFEGCLGENLYKTFCLYKREDTYRNEHYISDGLTNSEIIQKSKDFIEVAKKELEKARNPKLSISATLHNLLIMPEFKPLIHKFKLGNWLRICVDDIVYRLRLIGYDLSFSSIQTLSVEFANVTKLNTIANETKEILDSAQSMSTTYSYYAGQAKKGNEANVEVNRWHEEGLKSALIAIKNNNNEEITYDKHGLWAKTYDDITGNYSPKMLRVTHNIIAMTENNWETSSLAIGEHKYIRFDGKKFVYDVGYGVSAKFLSSPYIHGGQIISGNIYSENYKVERDVYGIVTKEEGSHINLIDGSFSFASGRIVYDGNNSLTFKNVTLDWNTSNKPEVTIDEISNGELKEFLEEFENELGDIAESVDKKADIWYKSEPPSTEWTTDEEKEKHVGDIWYCTTPDENGNCHTWVYNASYTWEEINGVPKEVFDMADGKCSLYVAIPLNGYKKNDIWILEADDARVSGYTYPSYKKGTETFNYEAGTFLVAKTERPNGVKDSNGNLITYSADDWEEMVKYSNKLEEFAETYSGMLDDISEQVDKKANSYYQSSEPHPTYKNEAENTEYDSWVGDLWFDTDVNKSFVYVKTLVENGLYNYEWLEADGVPDDVYNKINGKCDIYVEKPSSQKKGDLIIPNETFYGDFFKDINGQITYIQLYFFEGKIYKCIEDSDEFNPELWEEVAYTDNTVANSALEIGNKLIEGLGFEETEITGEYVISPYIGGGYLDIHSDANLKKSRVVIDPNNILGEDYIFLVKDKNDNTMIGFQENGNAEFKGIVNATELYTEKGTIAGWNITADALYNNKSTNNDVTNNNGIPNIENVGTELFPEYVNLPGKGVGMSSDLDGICFWAGSTSEYKDYSPFRVYSNGSVYMSDATIQGKIKTVSDDKVELQISNGNITTYTSTGTRGMVMYGGGIQAYAWNNPNIITGRLQTVYNDSYGESLGLSCFKDTYVALQYQSSNDDKFYYALTVNINKDNGGIVAHTPFTAERSVNINGYYLNINKSDNTNCGNIFAATNNIFVIRTESSDIPIYLGHKNESNGTKSVLTVSGTGGVNVYGNFAVSGTKSRLASTATYGDRLLYCYETPSPMFGDVGEGKTDETGKCYIFIDDIFAETIDSSCSYQVFLQPYGQGECYVSERTPSYFVVEGKEELSFGWEIKAVQRKYDTVRLEEPKEYETSNSTQIVDDTSEYLQSLLYNIESEEF